jgi:methyl-accepting chemotaxis protein
MKEELLSLNKKAFDQSKQIECISISIHKLVMEGVISLQFDDIVRQILDKVNTQVQALNEYHHEVMSAQKEDMSIGFEHRLLEKINNMRKALSVKRESLENINTSGVQQSSVDTGEIDLF